MTANTGGFAGNILYVDLNSGAIHKQALDYDLARKFIGGLGLCIKLAYDTIIPGTDALSPDNPIVLGAGPLVGTNLPSCSRVYAVTKFPASETIGWCGAGGVNFGYLFKNAGYDHVVIKGQADHPVYLKMMNDRVEICDATALWGKDVEETDQILRESVKSPCGAITIGQAGENRVVFSMAFLDKMANVREGAEREKEAIPDQWIGATGFKNYVTGTPLTRREIERMVEDYYAEWGWDRKSGVPTAEVLENLGLVNI
jgi:aldehyde:ferredoxin oxidoreductase